MDAAYFDQWYSDIGRSTAQQRLFTDSLGVPPEVGPQDLVPLDGLRALASALAVEPGGLLVDLDCGRGGPGMWIARELGAELVGVDFSREAIAQATERRALFGLTETATFAVGTFDATGLSSGVADAVVCIDAIQFAPDRALAVEEVRRIVRPGGRVAMTSWEPADGVDPSALPERLRDLDLHAVLDRAGFVDVRRELKPDWDRLELALWERAAQLDAAGDPALESVVEEGKASLAMFDKRHRVMVTATAPS
jgi:SAM-dependent methyltransferase